MDILNDECDKFPGIKEVWVTPISNIENIPEPIRIDGKWRINGTITMLKNRYYKIDLKNHSIIYFEKSSINGGHGNYMEQSIGFDLEDMTEKSTSNIISYEGQKLSVLFLDNSGQWRIMGDKKSPAYLTMNLNSGNTKSKISRDVVIGKLSDEICYHYHGLLAILEEPKPPLLLDLFPTDKGGCFTKASKANYYSGAAFILKRDSDWAEQTVYFKNGELDPTDFISFFGANPGSVVAGFNHNDGTIMKSCDSYGATDIAYAPQIWNGSDFIRNEDGEIALSIQGNAQWKDHNFVNNEFWSVFVVTNRKVDNWVLFSMDTSRFMFRSYNSGAFAAHGGLLDTPISSAINGIDLSPVTSFEVHNEIPKNIPAVVSAMNLKIGSGWNKFLTGGPQQNGYHYNSYWSGEAKYLGDKSSDESDIVDILMSMYGIS